MLHFHKATTLSPDFISEKVMKESKINANGDGDCYPCMGCRSFLTPDRFTDKGVGTAILNDASQRMYYGE